MVLDKIKSTFKVAVATIVVAAFFYQRHQYNSEIDDLRKVHDEFIEQYKSEKKSEIDSLKKAQEKSIQEFNENVNSLKSYNNYLNKKIKNYGKNPDFNDYDFLERANNVSKYKYKSGE